VAVYFLDSSAVVKRYVHEIGTLWVQQLADPASANRIEIASITAVEVIAAIARRQRAGHTSVQEAIRAIARFRADLQSDFQAIEITDAVVNHAMDLAERHGLRGYDAIQLAAALALSSICKAIGTPVTFVSADGELNAAALKESLAVEDPSARP